MAIELSRLEIPVEVVGDTTAIGALRRVDRAGQRTTQVFENMTRRTASGMQVAARAAAAFGAALTAQVLVRGTASLARLGSAVEETGTKFEAVFGQTTSDMDRFVRDFGRMAGLTQREGREVTATLGGIAQGLGATRDQAAELAQQMVRLGGDLSSFNNTSLDEALTAIRAGLTGESEPLKRFGVVLTQADAQLRALATTGKRSAKDLTQLELVAARVALMVERAGVASGDLARTQDSTANTTRRLAAQFRGMQESLATAMLPAVAALTRGLADMVGWLQDHGPLVGGLTAATAAMGAAALAAKGLTAALTALASGALVRLGAALAALAVNPVVLGLAALGVVVGGLTYHFLAGKREADAYAERLRKIADMGDHARARLQRLFELGAHGRPVPAGDPVDPKEANRAYLERVQLLGQLVESGAATQAEIAELARADARARVELAKGNTVLAERRAFLLDVLRLTEQAGASTAQGTGAMVVPPVTQRLANDGRGGLAVGDEWAGTVEAAYQQALARFREAEQDLKGRAMALAQALDSAIKGAMVDAFAALGNAIAGGTANVGKALLGGLGRAFQQFGVALIAGAKIIQKALTALSSLNPVGAIIAGGALIALGAALTQAASSSFGGGGGGGAYAGGTALPDSTTTITYSPRANNGVGAATEAAQLKPAQPFNVQVTYYGGRDPAFESFVAEQIVAARRRGYDV